MKRLLIAALLFAVPAASQTKFAIGSGEATFFKQHTEAGTSYNFRSTLPTTVALLTAAEFRRVQNGDALETTSCYFSKSVSSRISCRHRTSYLYFHDARNKIGLGLAALAENVHSGDAATQLTTPNVITVRKVR